MCTLKYYEPICQYMTCRGHPSHPSYSCIKPTGAYLSLPAVCAIDRQVQRSTEDSIHPSLSAKDMNAYLWKNITCALLWGLSSCNRTGSATSSIASARRPPTLWLPWLSSALKYFSISPAPPTATTSSPGETVEVWFIDTSARLPPFSTTPATRVDNESSNPIPLFDRLSVKPRPKGLLPCNRGQTRRDGLLTHLLSMLDRLFTHKTLKLRKSHSTDQALTLLRYILQLVVIYP